MEHRELEEYLNQLEKFLTGLPTSERAEILIEIKSHVLDKKESDGNRSISEILNDLGTPGQVAQKYLLERGVEFKAKRSSSDKTSVVKWLVIGVLGLFSISVVSLFVLIWRFSPLIDVDEELGRVKILGGLIDVNEKEGSVKIRGAISTNNSLSLFGHGHEHEEEDYELKMDLYVDGKKVASPHMVVEEGKEATVVQQVGQDKIIIEFKVEDKEVKGSQVEMIRVKTKISSVDADGKKVVRSRSRLLAPEGEEMVVKSWWKDPKGSKKSLTLKLIVTKKEL